QMVQGGSGLIPDGLFRRVGCGSGTLVVQYRLVPVFQSIVGSGEVELGAGILVISKSFFEISGGILLATLTGRLCHHRLVTGPRGRRRSGIGPLGLEACDFALHRLDLLLLAFNHLLVCLYSLGLTGLSSEDEAASQNHRVWWIGQRRHSATEYRPALFGCQPGMRLAR